MDHVSNAEDLGFWNLRSDTASGNSGLLDQLMALNWTRQNIANFGGDPEKITMAGSSAGGASVSLLNMSPLSQGLFSKAIMQSGSGLAIWATTKGITRKLDDEKPDGSKMLVDKLGCSDQDERKILSCMQEKPLDELSKAALAVNVGSYLTWTPRIGDSFLPKDVKELAASRKPVPTIIGATKDEFAFFEFTGFGGKPDPTTTYEKLVDAIPKFVPSRKFPLVNKSRAVFKCKYADYSECRASTAKNQKLFWLDQAISMKSNLMFWAAPVLEAEIYKKNGANVFYYEFDYVSRNALRDAPLGYRGVVHASENFFYFSSNLNLSTANYPDENWVKYLVPTEETPEDKQMGDLIQTLWTNFAKHGNPTPDKVFDVTWQEFDPNEHNYLSINLPNPAMKSCFKKEEIAFYKEFVQL